MIPKRTLAELVDALLGLQAPDGALPMAPPSAGREQQIVPYFANFGAIGLIAAARSGLGDAPRVRRCRDAARRWVLWFDAHRNRNGTIDDHHGRPGAWQPTGHYDSSDSYAATYLELLAALQELAPDPAWLRGRYPFIRRSIDAIRLTRQPIGLTTATPTYPVMYTMDNVEVLRGLQAAATLAKSAGNAADARSWSSDADATNAAIARRLWDGANGCFLVGVQTDGGRLTGLSKWYPDIMANLMAIGWLPTSRLWSAVDRTALYSRLTARFAGDTAGVGIPAAGSNGGEIERLIWWGYAARAAEDVGRLAAIRAALTAVPTDRLLGGSEAPATLGHICRLLTEEPRR